MLVYTGTLCSGDWRCALDLEWYRIYLTVWYYYYYVLLNTSTSDSNKKEGDTVQDFTGTFLQEEMWGYTS
jgi:hypothetical protein